MFQEHQSVGAAQTSQSAGSGDFSVGWLSAAQDRREARSDRSPPAGLPALPPRNAENFLQPFPAFSSEVSGGQKASSSAQSMGNGGRNLKDARKVFVRNGVSAA